MGRTKPFLQRLLVTFILINVAVVAIVWLTLWQSRQQYEERAAVVADNLSQLLAQNIGGLVQRIDLSVLATVDEVEREAAHGGVAAEAINAFIARQHQRQPDIDSLRFADAAGIIRYGVGVKAGSQISLADRDFFSRLRDEPAAGLVVSQPILGRISGEWGIVLGRRCNRPDGSFGGIAYAVILLKHFQQMFAPLALGPHGVISLRTLDMAMVARHPMPSGANAGIGNKTVSRDFLDHLQRDPAHGNYIAPTGLDGINRTISYRRMSGYAAYVIVGLATEDYLADWRREVGKMSALVSLFILTTLFAGGLLWRAWRRQEKSNASQATLAQVFSNSSEAIIISDGNNRIIAANPAFSRLTGYSEEEALGRDPGFLTAGRTPREIFVQMWSDIATKGCWEGELWDRRKSGEAYPKWLVINVVRDGRGKVVNYIGSFVDISERKATEEKISRLARLDALTNLPNRFSLHERLEQALSHSRRSGKQLALLLIDLDRFKAINDTLGHSTGDQLLVQVAQRLSKAVRDSDIVARLGGDEFVVVLPGLDSPADAAYVADKIVVAVSAPYSIDAHELGSSPSIGIALYPDDAADSGGLLKNADVAMYHAKALGRGCYQFFTEDMNTAALARMAIESDLRVALERKQFVVHYQPQIDLVSGALVGWEALLRWQHPQRGLVAPKDFIPVAEDTGLIVPLGAWVLGEACAQLQAWRRRFALDLRMSVNLSPLQFQDGTLCALVEEALSAAGLEARCLDLEVTESMAMRQPEESIVTMRALRDIGVTLAIDDFGTGYSSLAYLKLFPIHSLKIDRSFVKDIERDADDAAICDTTIALAHKLGLRVIAEGVETEAQKEFLRRAGCDMAQGYLISKPLLADAAAEFIAAFIAARQAVFSVAK